MSGPDAIAAHADPSTAPLGAPLAGRELAGGVAAWGLLGVLMGGFAPGVVAIFMPEPWGFAGFILTSEVFGLVSGVLLGVLDLPRRLPWSTPPRIAASLALGVPLGVLWGAAAGAVGGLGLTLSFAMLDGFSSGWSDAIGGISLIGAVLGVMVGTPGVALFCGLRAVTLSLRWPWWLAHVGALGLTAVLALPMFVLSVGSLIPG